MDCKKSTLEVFSNNIQDASIGAPIEFPNIAVKTGHSVKNLTNTTIQLSPNGLYQVNVNVSGYTSTKPGNMEIRLFRNGVAVPYAVSQAFSNEPLQPENLSFSCLLLVNPSCCAVDNTTTLTVVNTGIDSTYENANITIVKLA